MAQQIINVGTTANDGQGDPIRTAFQKTNSNFTEIYNATIGLVNTIVNGNSNISIDSSNANITVTVDSTANVIQFTPAGQLVTGVVSATGNITGSYILGNGSQLTGINANYSNSNVVSLMAGFGSNTISTTGNVTAGNFVGNSLSSASNVSLSAVGAVRITGGTFRLPSFTTAQLANITGVPGDLVYNTSVNKVQAWQYDATDTFTWVSLAVSTYQ